MALTKLKKVSKKKRSSEKKKKSCRKSCKSKVQCIKSKCAKVDNELWKLNWTYNKLIAQINKEVIIRAKKHGKIDKKLFDKTKNMFLDKPHKSFYDLFSDVKQKTFNQQMAKKLQIVNNAIKSFSNYERKARANAKK